MSVEQITAILEGKRDIAPPREIQEVRNAIIPSVADEIIHVRPQIKGVADRYQVYPVLSLSIGYKFNF